MQRRRFFRTVSTVSSAATVAAQQASRVSEPAKIASVLAEVAAEPASRFFSATQFATLRSLGRLLQPALNGRPGAAEAGAAEFLDFLIGVSAESRQRLYTGGLDFLDAESRRLFKRPFPELSEEQADTILRPLIVPWTFDPPVNPRQRFLSDVRADLRTATLNSKEMSLAPQAGGARRRRGPGGPAPYWLPMDPTR